MPELRYELIGDASRFEKAGRDVVNVSEQMGGAINALEQHIAALTDGQVQLRNEQGQFVGSMREAANGAEVQAAALRELNSEGIRTEEQIENQIARLERLEQVYEGDAAAVAQLSQRQARLQQELAQYRGDATQAEAATERLANAQERAAQTSTSMRHSASAAAANLNIEMTQALQDVQFGIAGLANQIPLMAEQFGQLRERTGSTSGALTELRRSLMGPVGVIAAGTLLVQMAPQIIDFFQSFGDGADSARESLDSTADSVFRLADSIRESIPLTRQFAEQSVQALQDNLSTLRSELNRANLQGVTLGGGITPGVEDSTAQLRERANISEAALDRLEERIQNRRALNALLEVERETITENTTLTRAQVDALQRQEATLTTITAAVKQDVISQEQAASMAQSRLNNTEEIRASQSVLNSLLSQGLITEKQLADARERIADATEEAGEETEENLTRLEEQIQKTNEITEALQFANSEKGQEVANQRALNRLLQQQLERQQRINRLQAEGLDRQLQALTAPQQVPTAGTAAEEVQREGVTMDITPDMLAQLPSKYRQAAEEIDDGVNRQLEQGIQLASQLGATLIQAAQQGGASFQQVFGSILQTVGAIVGLGNPVAGSAIAGAGTVVSALQHGGRVNTPFQLVGERGPELAMLPQGTQVHSNPDTEKLLANRSITVNLQTEVKRMNGRELGLILRNNDSRRDQFGYTSG